MLETQHTEVKIIMAEEVVNTNTNTDDPNQTVSAEGKVYTQAELEKLIQAESDRKVSLAQSRWQKETSKKLTEAEKLAKMSEEDKFKYQLEQKELELAAKEKEFALKSNKIEAMKVLSQKQIPAELVDFVVSEDAETMMANINLLDKHIKEIVAAQVKTKLAGSAPKASTSSTEALTPESFNKMTYSQRMEIYSSNPELYKKLSGK